MRIRRLLGGLILLGGSGLQAQDSILTLGGTVTEIVFALGEGARVRGVDSSSVYPPEGTGKLPKTGYVRALGAEGLVALGAPVVLAIPDAGPPGVVEQVKSAEVVWHTVPGEESWEGVATRIRFIAQKLGVEPRGRILIQALEAQRRGIEVRQASRRSPPPRVLFVFAHGPGTLQVSGTGTAADRMITLAGGQNVVQDFGGYKPLTAEALSRLNPDVILLTHRGLESLGGKSGLAALPAFADPQILNRARLLSYDDLFLLGFGPRLGEAVDQLDRDLHGGS